MFKLDLNQNVIKLYFIRIMMVIQVILVALGVASIIVIMGFIINSNWTYSKYLPGIKSKMIETYKSSGYNFIQTSIENRISNTVDLIVKYLTENIFDSYFLSFGIVIIINFIATLIGLISCETKWFVLLMSGILSLGLGIYFLYRLIISNDEIKLMSHNLLNNTHYFRKKIHICVICYRNLNPINFEDSQITNTLALALHAFKCCGIESYEDVLFKDEIPYTCCPRSTYITQMVRSSSKCKIDDLYPSCIDTLLPYMKSSFAYMQVLLGLLWIFNWLYAIPLIIFQCKYRKVQSKRKKVYNFTKYSNIAKPTAPRIAHRYISKPPVVSNTDSRSTTCSTSTFTSSTIQSKSNITNKSSTKLLHNQTDETPVNQVIRSDSIKKENVDNNYLKIPFTEDPLQIIIQTHDIIPNVFSSTYTTTKSDKTSSLTLTEHIDKCLADTIIQLPNSSISEPNKTSIKPLPILEPKYIKPNQTNKHKDIKLRPLNELRNIKANPVNKPSVKSNTLNKTNIQSNTFNNPDVTSNPLSKPDVKSNLINKPDVKSNLINKPDVKSNLINKPDVKSNTLSKPNIKSNLSDKSRDIKSNPLIKPMNNRKNPHI